MLDVIEYVGDWILSLVEAVSGRIDPQVRAWLTYVVAAVTAILPIFGALRAIKMVRAWWRGEKPEITSGEATRIAETVVDKRLADIVDYDKLAEAIVRKQAERAKTAPTEAEIAVAARSIASVAQTAAESPDDEAHEIAEALGKDAPR